MSLLHDFSIPLDGSAALSARLTAPVVGWFDSTRTRQERPFAAVDTEGALRAGDGPGAGLVLRRSLSATADGSVLALDVRATSAVREVALTQAVELELPWSSYVIAPGAVYDGNRFVVISQPYCPEPPSDGALADGPVFVVDVPRLTATSGYRADLAANAMTTPRIGVFDPKSGRGALVEFAIYGAWGVTGVELITLPGRPVVVRVHLPVMRKRRYRLCDWVNIDDEPGLSLEAGAEFRFEARVVGVTAADIPAFIAALNRRAYATRDRGELRAFQDLPGRLREVGELVEAKFDHANWNEQLGVYQSVALTRKNPAHLLQIGWVSGGMVAVAMMGSASPERRARGRRMMDVISQGAQTPSGYFYDYLLPDGTWGGFNRKWPGRRPYLFVRRSLEFTRDLVKAVQLLRARGETPPAAWETSARRALDAIVSTMERHGGHCGYFVDPDTGDVILGATTCGAFAIEGLVRGRACFGDERYLAAAKQVATFAHDRYLMKGYTCGGVADALMAVDSESNYALLSGLVHLHETTRDPLHLEWAVKAAELFQTWVLLYDAKVPEGSPLQKLGVEPRGAVFANIQNQHGTPGICEFSGLELKTLAERTGDARWMVLLREIAACIPQMVVRPGQEWIWEDQPVGAVSERLMTMDGLKPNGHTYPCDTFSAAALVTSRELTPGVLAEAAAAAKESIL